MVLTSCSYPKIKNFVLKIPVVNFC